MMTSTGLLGEVADGRCRVGGLDVVDHDRVLEAVVLRQLLGGVDDCLVVRAVVGGPGGGDSEHDLAVAVGVEKARLWRALVAGASVLTGWVAVGVVAVGWVATGCVAVGVVAAVVSLVLLSLPHAAAMIDVAANTTSTLLIR